MIGIVLLFLARRTNRLARLTREAYKIERMGDYYTAHKLAQQFGESEDTITDWCAQGRVPGAFQAENLWLIPRDTTMNDIDLKMVEQPKGNFQS